jgi:hypothetical protein
MTLKDWPLSGYNLLVELETTKVTAVPAAKLLFAVKVSTPPEYE